MSWRLEMKQLTQADSGYLRWAARHNLDCVVLPYDGDKSCDCEIVSGMWGAVGRHQRRLSPHSLQTLLAG